MAKKGTGTADTSSAPEFSLKSMPLFYPKVNLSIPTFVGKTPPMGCLKYAPPINTKQLFKSERLFLLEKSRTLSAS